jgi:hypothetical protein
LGFLIVPAAIVPFFVWHLKSIKKRHRPLSLENIGENLFTGGFTAAGTGG